MSQTPEIAIRLARATFNRALADADLTSIAPLLAPNAILVTGTDSGVISGRKAQLAAWKREFSAANRMIYTRTPEAITVSPAEPIAFEHGHWHAVSASDGQPLSSGAYTAKWRRLADDWMIEAELFLTLV